MYNSHEATDHPRLNCHPQRATAEKQTLPVPPVCILSDFQGSQRMLFQGLDSLLMLLRRELLERIEPLCLGTGVMQGRGQLSTHCMAAEKSQLQRVLWTHRKKDAILVICFCISSGSACLHERAQAKIAVGEEKLP
ncbi:hypothetical protein EK904_001663 [Melospiza melodia maxima]|nr:hypothetical protein EK904_001663 [Melospiza melodia maxima]